MSPASKLFLGCWLALYVGVTLALKSYRATAAEWSSWGIDVLNTATLFAMLAFFVWPLLRGLIDAAIADQNRAAEAAATRLAKAEEERAAARIRLAGIAEEVEAVRRREREATADEVRHLAELAAAEARQIKEHGARDRVREAERLRRQVVARIAARAKDKARATLVGRLDGPAQERLVRELLAEVEAA